MNDGAGGIYAEGNLAIALEQVEGSHLVERLPVGARLNVEVALATSQTIPPSDMNRHPQNRALRPPCRNRYGFGLSADERIIMSKSAVVWL